MSIKVRLNTLLQDIETTKARAGRENDHIVLVGVSKFHEASTVADSIAAGLSHLGESRVQELEQKKPLVEQILIGRGIDPGAVTWHMIGHLQTNKAVRAVGLVDMIQSVDNVSLAEKISKAAIERGEQKDILIEVNTSGEASKSGVNQTEANELTEQCLGLNGLHLQGFMTVGPLTDDESRIRASFRKLNEIRNTAAQKFGKSTNDWHLSMGMSGDYRIAIEEGATMLRIGSAIFGSRG